MREGGRWKKGGREDRKEGGGCGCHNIPGTVPEMSKGTCIATCISTAHLWGHTRYSPFQIKQTFIWCLQIKPRSSRETSNTQILFCRVDEKAISTDESVSNSLLVEVGYALDNLLGIVGSSGL